MKRKATRTPKKRTRFLSDLAADKLLRLAGKIARDRVSVYAAQASFFFVISAVPFIMLLLSMVQYIMPMDETEMADWVQTALPTALQFYALRAVEDLYTNTTVSLVSFTAVVMLWIASQGVYALVRALNEMHHITDTRNPILVRLFSLLDTLMVLLLLILSLVLIVFGRQVVNLLNLCTPEVVYEMELPLRFRNLFSTGLIALIFAWLYKMLPNLKVAYLSQLPGAVFSAVGWMLFSMLYEFYINHFAHYSVTYGSLGALVLMLLWLYNCMQIFLIGAEINLWLLENRTNHLEHGRSRRLFP